DRTVLCKKHVVGAHRRARRHRVCRYSHLLQRGTQVGGKRTDVLARAHQQDFDLIGFGKNLLEIRHRECVRMARPPAVDARRQAKKRATMRHIREAEAPVAIGLDRRTARIMGLTYDDALCHFAASGAVCSAASIASFETGRRWTRIRIGAAMKIDEKVPMKTPNSIEATKERMTSPPSKNSASRARKVVTEVIVVRASISLSDRSSNWPSGIFLNRRRFSRTRSSITSAPMSAWPVTVMTAATAEEPD